jgi:hypothetical protein
VTHQAIVEFVAAATRTIRVRSILILADALREAEEFLAQFKVQHDRLYGTVHAVNPFLRAR